MAAATKTKDKANPKPRLEIADEATIPEQIEAVVEYLDEKYGGSSVEELRERVAGVSRDLREVESDLDTGREGLEDALAADMADLDGAVADDPGARIEAKRFNEERERLARQMIKREHLKRLLIEAQTAHGLRVSRESDAEAKKLAEELVPKRGQLKALEAEVRVLEDRLTTARHVTRENQVTKVQVSAVIAAQRPDLSGLRQYVSYR